MPQSENCGYFLDHLQNGQISDDSAQQERHNLGPDFKYSESFAPTALRSPVRARILTTDGALILVEAERNRCTMRVWNPHTQCWWRTDLCNEGCVVPEAPRG